MNFLLLVLTLFYGPPPTEHDFKMSVTEIIVPPASDSVWTVKCYLFHDDLKQALYQRPEADSVVGKDIDAYLQQHIKLSDKHHALVLQWSGFREKNDQILAEFTANPENFPQGGLTVHNSILVDLFPGQKNVVYLIDSGGKRHPKLLDRDQQQAVFDKS